MIQAFRPDRLLAMAHTFVSTNLGESFMSIMEQPLDLTHIVDTEVSSACRALCVAFLPRGAGGYPALTWPVSVPTGEAQYTRPHVLRARL